MHVFLEFTLKKKSTYISTYYNNPLFYCKHFLFWWYMMNIHRFINSYDMAPNSIHLFVNLLEESILTLPVPILAFIFENCTLGQWIHEKMRTVYTRVYEKQNKIKPKTRQECCYRIGDEVYNPLKITAINTCNHLVIYTTECLLYNRKWTILRRFFKPPPLKTIWMVAQIKFPWWLNIITS